MRKFVKISVISSALILLVGVLSISIFLASSFVKYSSLALIEENLTAPTLSIDMFDQDNRPIKELNSFSRAYAPLSTLPKYVPQAFVAIEDQSFYSHHGLNYKRMIKAALNNLSSRSMKEGASTISQQLIKNTHLSSEKTFERKFKEISLTKKLEKKHSKDEILDYYLNIIYYGNNCYGIENAAQYYFSKPAKELEISEAALLAGMIKSPSRYSPIIHTDKAQQRRNLVLSQMQKCKFITEEDALRAKNSPIKLELCQDGKNFINSYAEAALDEACNILKVPARDIAAGGFKIHTYMQDKSQQKLKEALNCEDFDDADHAAIVVDASKHAVIAYEGSSAYKIISAKRQPGSLIKPILVYAPALNEDLISPSTMLLDEELSLGEYTPKNVDGKFRGYVSATDAVSKSINIPAIKVLSYVGLEKAKLYAEQMGLKFDEEDNNLAIALGGMHYGTTIKDIAGAYSTLANAGRFSEPKFIEYITDASGKILYRHKIEEIEVLREDACFLMTTMLQETAKTGTAKALGQLDLNLAAKTGTVGRGKHNSDAWCACYSPSEVCVMWVGNLDNSPISVAGGNQPTRCVKKYFEDSEKQVFTQPSSIVTRKIDDVILNEEHRVVLADENLPERFTSSALFSVFNLPERATSTKITQTHFDIKNNNGHVQISWNAHRHITYKFYDDNFLIKTVNGLENEQMIELNITSGKLKICSEYAGQEDVQNFTLQIPQKEKLGKWFL